MTGQALRIRKEVRALFWPWCSMMCLGAMRPLAAVLANDASWGNIGIAGFYLGIPVLAVLSFGNEFQQRTVSLLFVQPIERLQIWREKCAVMLAATGSVAFLYYMGWRSGPDWSSAAAVGNAAFFVTAIGSAVFWTFLARSTVGAVILNIAVQATILAATLGLSKENPAHESSILSAGLAVSMLYAAAMLWLGRRKVVRFQATGEMASPDVLTVFSRLVPDSVARCFQSSPRGASLNLIKREIRLLRPVVVLVLLTVAFLVLLAPFRFVTGANRDIAQLGAAAVAMSLLLAAVLAGCVSMGEERPLGTHSWHLTLPVSVSRQWLIKFAAAMFASAGCVLVVTGAARLTLGSSFYKLMFETIPGIPFWLLCVLVLTFTTFWCACAVNGTIRAAAWVIPSMLAVAAAAVIGGAVLDFPWPVHRIVLNAHAFPPSQRWIGIVFGDWIVSLVFIVPASLAIVQSYRSFRAEQADNVRSLGRPLIQLCLIVFALSFFVTALEAFTREIWAQESAVMLQVGWAVDNLELDPATLDAAHPRAITSADLSKVFALSDTSRIWLAKARITVSPRPATHSLRYFRAGKWQEPAAKYAANVYYPNGTECRIYDVNYFCRQPGEPVPEYISRSLY